MGRDFRKKKTTEHNISEKKAGYITYNGKKNTAFTINITTSFSSYHKRPLISPLFSPSSPVVIHTVVLEDAVQSDPDLLEKGFEVTYTCRDPR